MTYPQIRTVDCAICGETVTIAIESERWTPIGIITRPTVLAGCEHFYKKDEHHEA